MKHISKRMMRRLGVSIVCLALTFALVPALTPVLAAKALGAPKTIKYSDRTYNSITLKWSKVSKAKSYNVYVCYPGTKKFKKVKTVKGNSKVTYKVTGLKKGQSYKLRICACKTAKGTGVGKASKAITVKTLKPGKYTINPGSIPRNKKMLRYSYYNKYTRTYYTIRSYMEWFEKCNGGTLILDPGTYSVTNTIFVPSNVTILLRDGAVIKKGTNTHLSGLKASNSLFHFVKPSKGQSKAVYGKYDGAKNISLIGKGTAVIDMSYQSKCNCIEAGHNQNLTIENITFQNVSGGHFIEMDAVKGATVNGCTFKNIRDSNNVREAINLDTPDAATGGFTAVWSKMDCTADNGITIKNCIFKNMPRAIGTHNYSYGHPHKNIKIRGCVISKVTSFGIGMMYWQNAEITGCTITGTHEYGNDKFDGILGKGVFGTVKLYRNSITNFRYPMLFKDSTDNGKKIYNNISENDMGLMENNTGEMLGRDHIYIESNNNGKSSRIKIFIELISGDSNETDNSDDLNDSTGTDETDNSDNLDNPNNPTGSDETDNPDNPNDPIDQNDTGGTEDVNDTTDSENADSNGE